MYMCIDIFADCFMDIHTDIYILMEFEMYIGMSVCVSTHIDTLFDFQPELLLC